MESIQGIGNPLWSNSGGENLVQSERARKEFPLRRLQTIRTVGRETSHSRSQRPRSLTYGRTRSYTSASTVWRIRTRMVVSQALTRTWTKHDIDLWSALEANPPFRGSCCPERSSPSTLLLAESTDGDTISQIYV